MVAVVAVLAALHASPPPPDCAALARDAVRRAERRPIGARAEYIFRRLRAEPALGCGVVGSAHWTRPVSWPARCRGRALSACPWPRGLELAPSLVRDADPTLVARVQGAVTALRSERKLSPAHERMFSMLVLFDAKRRAAERGPASAPRRK